MSVIQHATTWDALRPLSPDERRGAWAAKFYGCGKHREPVAACHNPPEAPWGPIVYGPCLSSSRDRQPSRITSPPERDA